MAFNPAEFRKNFPYFQQPNAAVYFDSAATSLKPQALIDATVAFYQSAGSVHRSQYDEQQTTRYEQARSRVKKLLNAESEQSIIWTSGTTHSINLVANGLLPQLTPQNEIIISEAEHHANFVSWQQLSQKTGAKLIVLPLQTNGVIDDRALKSAVQKTCKIVALNMMSNVTGVVQPLADLIPIIRRQSNALILADAAQAIHHLPIDLQQLDVDFLTFSAHKIYGPTGLGVLAGKLTALNRLQPLLFGGKMVQNVSPQHTEFAELPYKLEAGTPNIAGVIGFNAVLEWLEKWDKNAVHQYVAQLSEKIIARLQQYPTCQLFAYHDHSPIISFLFKHIDLSDLATLLAEQNIALRAGEHCAQPYLASLGQRGTLRLSLAPYNNEQDIEHFFNALDKALALLD
ncbi:cysteine desulfurase [Avibacterium sp. 20-15]|uniref:aminotransferase class V-fold PLP-dependent enzyme n=1 Tax=unclassified Avibacterium TaxID=2685287 RepID=UPI002026D1F3|nr:MULTISPECIES: cysteine desulfurase [unclassified Avibacterium]MCW9732010.1 cysteine desulfurase [Avibacterium sp. 20-15]URL04192.1 cysteine desulfurase [Avibacterium sp. 20-132]